MTQKDRILHYLRRCGSISPVEAFSELGCYRLRARIYDLRADGYDITSELESHQNRFGETVSYARYTLHE
jgi:hypothetical protein